MNALLQISRFIYQHNPWYTLPWKFISAFFYQCHKRISKKPKVKTLFNNKKIYLFPGNPISSAFVYCAIPDKEEIFALRRLADEQTIFLDIGANIGTYSLMLLDKVKEVYAFEAHPVTAACCKQNFALNGVNEAQVFEVAVSCDQNPKLFSNDAKGCPTNSIVASGENAITVLATTLDAFIESKQFAPNANFILKVDVEGFEHEVFQGAIHFLKNYAVKGIIFETFSHQLEDILTLLNQLGFSTHALGNNNMLATRDTYAQA